MRSPNRLKTVEVYDPAKDIWRKSQGLRNARSGLATGVVDGVIYAIGGAGWPPIANRPGPYLASVEAFNPKATQALWREKTEMPTPRGSLTVSVINENIYAIGGALRENGPFMFISKVERYDTQNDTWRQLSDMPSGKLGHAAGVINGQIYILGGRRADHNGELSTVEVYDPGEVSQSVNPSGKLVKTWGRLKKIGIEQ